MSLGFANMLTNSTGGLSRLWCETCKQETLHQRGKCGCGTAHQVYPLGRLAQHLRAHIGHTPRRRK